MFSIGGAMSSIVALLLITVLGYVAAKLGYLNDGNKDHLAKLMLNITLPCMVIASVAKIDASQGSSQIGWTVALAFISYFVMIAISAVCILVLRVPREERKMYLFMGTLTNTGFIGIAVVAAVLGGGSMFLGSLYPAIMGLFIFTISTGILSSKPRKDPNAPGRMRAIDVKSLVKRVVNIPLIASIAAIVLFFSGATLPDPIIKTFDMTGAITAPLAMMLTGQMIAGSRIRELLTEWRLYGFIVLRMVAAPIVAWLVLGYLGVDQTVACVFTLMLSMPVGTMVPIFAALYQTSEKLAVKGTVLTTVASFITLPIILAVMALF